MTIATSETGPILMARLKGLKTNNWLILLKHMDHMEHTKGSDPDSEASRDTHQFPFAISGWENSGLLELCSHIS